MSAELVIREGRSSFSESAKLMARLGRRRVVDAPTALFKSFYRARKASQAVG